MCPTYRHTDSRTCSNNGLHQALVSGDVLERLATFWDVDQWVGKCCLLESFTLRRRQTMTAARAVGEFQQLNVDDARVLAVAVHIHWVLRHFLLPQLLIDPQRFHLVHLAYNKHVEMKYQWPSPTTLLRKVKNQFCQSSCLHTIFWMNRLLTLISCTCMCHDHSLLGIFNPGLKSRPRGQIPWNLFSSQMCHS